MGVDEAHHHIESLKPGYKPKPSAQLKSMVQIEIKHLRSKMKEQIEEFEKRISGLENTLNEIEWGQKK